MQKFMGTFTHAHLIQEQCTCLFHLGMKEFHNTKSALERLFLKYDKILCD